jgi:hypothetical protein
MFLLRYDFLVIPIIRKQYGTDLLTTYGSKQLTWPAIASRLKGVGESADMSTALVALIRHVIGVDSPNIHIRNKATKVKTKLSVYSLSILVVYLVTSRRTSCCSIFQCCTCYYSYS